MYIEGSHFQGAVDILIIPETEKEKKILVEIKEKGISITEILGEQDSEEGIWLRIVSN